MAFDRIAELRLRQAIADGWLEDLSNRGQRLDLEEYFSTPEDVRMAYSVLKNANCLPEEVQLRNEIGAMERALGHETREHERHRLRREIAGLTLRLDILRDRAKLSRPR